MAGVDQPGKQEDSAEGGPADIHCRQPIQGAADARVTQAICLEDLLRVEGERQETPQADRDEVLISM